MATKDPTAEKWLAVVGFEGFYEVSSLGRVRSLDRTCSDGRKKPGRILKPTVRRGYNWVRFNVGSAHKETMVGRVVLSAFVRPPRAKEQCNHKDFDKSNNRPENLEWCSQQENIAHFSASGRRADQRGERNNRSKLTAGDILVIRERASRGESYRKISADFPVCKVAIGHIVRRESWDHVD